MNEPVDVFDRTRSAKGHRQAPNFTGQVHEPAQVRGLVHGKCGREDL